MGALSPSAVDYPNATIYEGRAAQPPPESAMEIETTTESKTELHIALDALPRSPHNARLRHHPKGKCPT